MSRGFLMYALARYNPNSPNAQVEFVIPQLRLFMYGRLED